MITYKNGEPAKKGDVVSWNCEDNEDFTTWRFIGVVKQQGVLYLGGGIDFGEGIGQIVPFEEVIAQSEDNDPSGVGVTYLGKVYDLVNYIGAFE